MKLITILKASLAGMLMAGGLAQAGTVSSQLFAGFQQLSDNSAEYLINEDGSLSDSGDSTVDLNDRLLGIFTIETVEDLNAGDENFLGGASGNNELSGVFDVTVASKFDIAGDGSAGFLYTFVSSGNLEAYGAGTAVAMFEDSAIEYSRLIDPIATLEGNITDGSLWLSMGLVGANTFWQAFAVSDDIAAIGAVPAPGNGGFFNLGLNFITNNTGFDFNQVACLQGLVDACGSGSLLGTGGVNTPFDSFDNVDFTVNRVPEPSTLLLLGLGLLGLGAIRKRAVNA